jgi:hypothetical protein
VLLVTVVGCSASEPTSATTVIFDGERFTLDGFVDCVRQLGGSLAINAPLSPKWGGLPVDGGRKLIRVVLTDSPRLVVKSAGIRLGDTRGFSDVSDEMWANKANDTYTINGRMAPDDGKTAAHQFEIDVTCSSIRQEYQRNDPPSG